MEYQATFGIDCGVSPRFKVIYPDYLTRVMRISAESPLVAFQNAMGLARRLTHECLSNPNTGFTTVQLLSLRNQEGDVPFDASKSVAGRLSKRGD